MVAKARSTKDTSTQAVFICRKRPMLRIMRPDGKDSIPFIPHVEQRPGGGTPEIVGVLRCGKNSTEAKALRESMKFEASLGKRRRRTPRAALNEVCEITPAQAELMNLIEAASMEEQEDVLKRLTGDTGDAATSAPLDDGPEDDAPVEMSGS